MTALLSKEKIEQQVAQHKGWRQVDNQIVRTVTLPSFPAALVFAAAVGHLAEAADHHPDILIQYKKVTLTLSTHSAGGLTQKDFDLAGKIEGLMAA